MRGILIQQKGVLLGFFCGFAYIFVTTFKPPFLLPFIYPTYSNLCVKQDPSHNELAAIEAWKLFFFLLPHPKIKHPFI